jgi:hypothetical protein
LSFPTRAFRELVERLAATATAVVEFADSCGARMA